MDDEEPETDGWTEVGKHSRKVITRAVRRRPIPIFVMLTFFKGEIH